MQQPSAKAREPVALGLAIASFGVAVFAASYLAK